MFFFSKSFNNFHSLFYIGIKMQDKKRIVVRTRPLKDFHHETNSISTFKHDKKTRPLGVQRHKSSLDKNDIDRSQGKGLKQNPFKRPQCKKGLTNNEKKDNKQEATSSTNKDREMIKKGPTCLTINKKINDQQRAQI